jgi:hypothetical protein
VERRLPLLQQQGGLPRPQQVGKQQQQQQQQQLISNDAAVAIVYVQ